MDADTVVKLVDRLGLPLALVAVLGAACVSLVRYIAKLIESQKLEREADRAAHLEKLGELTSAVNTAGASVRDLVRESAVTARTLERIEARVLVGARGHATLATLAILAVLALVAFCGCTGRVHSAETVHAELRGEMQSAQGSAEQEEREEGPTRETETIEDFAPAVEVVPARAGSTSPGPAVPAPTRLVRRTVRVTERGPVKVEVSRQETATAKATVDAKASAAKVTMVEVKPGFSFFTILFWGSLALLLVTYCVAAGGPLPLFHFTVAALRRLFGRKENGPLQG